jgi:Ca-activated chloride channel family protein
MTFIWPWMLLGLVAVPLLVAWYRLMLRRRAAKRRDLAALGLVAPGASASGRRRHVAPALFLAAMTLLLVALARPEATVAQPRREGTVVLAFDVSGSMAATDLSPTRMEAAKAAGKAFLQEQPPTVKVGVVAFGGSALVTQQPTDDRARVLAAIDRMTPQGGTGLARGLQTSLSAITGRPVRVNDTGSSSLEPEGQDLGYHSSAAVILLSDGENTEEQDPLELAEIASGAGVRVYPVGLGSPEGTVVTIDGFQVATALNEAMLRDIASTTDGEYFRAADEAALVEVYESIDLAWTVEAEQREVTGLLAAAAGLLLLLGAALSVTWFGRVV